MFINVEDKGDGILRTVSKGWLSIFVPKEFTVNCSGFTLADTDELNNIYKNDADIPMIKKNAPQLRCQLTAPSSAAINNLEKTFYISASLHYVYEITGETSVGIKPILT
jgi:hypothetical protein